MKWCKAPGFIFYPGPAPWFNPGPAAIAIRRPVCGNCCWIPHSSVIRSGLPLSVLVQIVIAGGILTHILPRVGREETAVAVSRPLIKIIVARRLHPAHLYLVC